MNDGQNGPIPSEVRERIIVRTSVLGIVANLLLAAFKAVVGILSNSIAVTLDAVNNLTDAMSSVVTIVGTKLAGKEPDKKHPLGYGRIEYLTTMIIAAIILYAGISSLIESIRGIIDPETAEYSTVTMVILGSAIFVKIFLGRHFIRTGKKVNSGSLVASGKDALYDAILSTSVFLSAVIFLLWNISLEAYVGLAIAAFIIKSGVEILIETLNDILGKRMDRELVDSVKQTICEDERVSGAYDLILHSYGPERTIGSVHIEVPVDMRADELDALERRISKKVYSRHGIIMGGIGIYTLNERDRPIREDITRIVMSHEGILQVHGFYIDRKDRILNMDIVIDYSIKDRTTLCESVKKEIEESYPDYDVHLNMDADI